MGVENREYMSDEADTFGTVRGHAISAVTLFIIINVVVWLVWQFAFAFQGRFLQFMNENFMCSFDGVFHHYRVHTLLTSSISHSEPYHILFNMLFFWMLGVDVEHFYGRRNFVGLYVVAGLAAALAQCGLNYFRFSDVLLQIPMLGASGSVMGVAVVAAFLDPQKPMLIFGFIPLKLWLLVAIYVLIDVSGALRGGVGIGHAAHLGGAFAGFLFYRMDLRLFASRGRKRAGIFYRLKLWWRGRKFRSIEGNVERPFTARGQRKALRESWNTPRPSNVDAESARRVDELLMKISRQGMDALTAEEREFLHSASEKYKRK